MAADWVASLPMYDFPELRDAHDAFWGAIAGRLVAAGLPDVPRALTRGSTLPQIWGNPRLLFAQGCEYPLAKAFGGRVRVVAHPVYAAAGCEGGRYRSAIVVRRVAPAAEGARASDAGLFSAEAEEGAITRNAGAGAGVASTDATPSVGVRAGGPAEARKDSAVSPCPPGTAAEDVDAAVAMGSDSDRYVASEVGGVGTDTAGLASLRGRRCVVNELDSNSGMNLLRAAIARLTKGESFFCSVVVSGSHLRSVEMVASGEADVAAIDCVSFAHFQRLYPSLAAGVQVLSWTASTPSLPYITAGTASDETVQALRAALADVFDDNRLARVRERLLLRGVDLSPKEGFGEVLNLERAAVSFGYPILR